METAPVAVMSQRGWVAVELAREAVVYHLAIHQAMSAAQTGPYRFMAVMASASSLERGLAALGGDGMHEAPHQCRMESKPRVHSHP